MTTDCGPGMLLPLRVFFFFFQNKVMSLLKILLIFDERLLSGQPPLSGDSAGTPRVAA